LKLINLNLIDEPLSICIEADGLVWDLHNAFDFVGLRQDIAERSVSLLWRSSRYSQSLLSAPQAFEITFAVVDYFEVTPRDPEIPNFGEDFCLSGLSRVFSTDDTQDLINFGVPEPNFPDENFHLWFIFRSGQHIRIGAESATFVLQTNLKV